MSERLSAREVKRHKWWGWGLDDVTFRYDNKPAFAPLAKNKVGVDLAMKDTPVEPELSDFEVPASRLPAAVRSLLPGAAGERGRGGPCGVRDAAGRARRFSWGCSAPALRQWFA